MMVYAGYVAGRPSFRRYGRQVAGVQQADKRRYPRLNLTFPVYVRTVTREGGETEERAETANVSSGGVLVETSRRLNVGEHVDVSITVPYTVWNRFPTVKVEAGAEVLRVSATPAVHEKGRKKYQTALRFDEPLRTVVW